MESKHTPGSWQQEGSYIYGPYPLRFTICQMHYPGVRWKEEWAANESLIKAAPDLLSALKDVQAAHCGMPKSCGHDYECTCVGDNARSAIAKAEGR